eukprot:PITA_01825
MGFVKSDADPNLYYLVVENEPLVLVLYVDDLFLTRSSRLIGDCKKILNMEFDIKDLEQMHYFLGLEVWQQKGEIFLGQGRYATEILRRFRMEDCRPMATRMITNWKKIDASEDKDVDPTLYKQLIGSTMYLVNTRPGICYAINTLCQLMVEPKRLGRKFSRKSTSGYCFNIGSRMTTWCSRKQKSMALSSVEAEYMVASTTLCEAIWLRKLLVNLFRRKMEATRIMCDNQSCSTDVVVAVIEPWAAVQDAAVQRMLDKEA